MIDTYSQEWLWICLARYVCRLPTKFQRRDFVDRFRHNHGKEVGERLDNLVKEQWPIIRKEMQNV